MHALFISLLSIGYCDETRCLFKLPDPKNAAPISPIRDFLLLHASNIVYYSAKLPYFLFTVAFCKYERFFKEASSFDVILLCFR